MAERAGASHVRAVEANKKAFLKCLVTKELLGLDRCSFYCGDAVEYLSAEPEPVDVCIACGILYHMTEPVRLIELISRSASQLVMWTHFYDDDVRANKKLSRRMGPAEEVQYKGFSHHVHRHRYGYDRFLTGGGFCAGTQPFSSWLPREELFRSLEHFGWGSIEVAFEDKHHLGGPSLALLAVRDQST